MPILLPANVPTTAGLVVNSVGPDRTPNSVASDMSTRFAKACLTEYVG